MKVDGTSLDWAAKAYGHAEEHIANQEFHKALTFMLVSAHHLIDSVAALAPASPRRKGAGMKVDTGSMYLARAALRAAQAKRPHASNMTADMFDALYHVINALTPAAEPEQDGEHYECDSCKALCAEGEYRTDNDGVILCHECADETIADNMRLVSEAKPTPTDEGGEGRYSAEGCTVYMDCDGMGLNRYCNAQSPKGAQTIARALNRAPKLERVADDLQKSLDTASVGMYENDVPLFYTLDADEYDILRDALDALATEANQ